MIASTATSNASPMTTASFLLTMPSLIRRRRMSGLATPSTASMVISTK